METPRDMMSSSSSSTDEIDEQPDSSESEPLLSESAVDAVSSSSSSTDEIVLLPDCFESFLAEPVRVNRRYQVIRKESVDYFIEYASTPLADCAITNAGTLLDSTNGTSTTESTSKSGITPTSLPLRFQTREPKSCW
jgi:hypothetical protein